MSLSPEIVVGMVRAIDVFLLVASAAAAFALYISVTRYSTAEMERYLLTPLVAAILFPVGFQRIGGYSLNKCPGHRNPHANPVSGS
jgi:hypothetical protein